MIAICSHTDPFSQLREGHWFTVHMWGSKSLYGKLCDLRRGFPLHAMWKTPPPHSPQLYAIFDFHCLSERVTSWHQIAKCLLYISSESQGESCLRCQREGFLGKQFIYSGFLDFSRYMQCHSLGGSSVSKDCPLYLCVIASWGVGIGLWLSEQELFGTLSYDSHTLWERGGCEHTTSIIVKKIRLFLQTCSKHMII